MRTFSYARAGDPATAVAAVLEDPEACFLGGGTNLVDLMRLGAARPTALVDITHLGLDDVRETPDGGLRIGATVRNSDLAAHAMVRARYPALARALLSGASGQLRNMATTAGNLLQRTRCVYFQQIDLPCNKRDPGSGCPARDGEHRDLAVVGHSAGCIATHPGDLAVALAALDAQVHIVGPDGPRALHVLDLYRLPGDRPQQDTVLQHGELITAVVLPPPTANVHSTYRKVRDRASFAFAVLSVAAVLELREEVVVDVRVAWGGLAAKPWRAWSAEAELRGHRLDVDALQAAFEIELREAEPLPDNAFKVPLARRLAVHTLLELAGEQS
jgi:xanthine dehydrogenase YagS FAD-binding subunit